MLRRRLCLPVATVVALTLSAALAACSGGGKAAAPPSIPPVTPSATTPTFTPPRTPTSTGSLLSGRDAADGPVLVVKLENTSAARPQSGLTAADVVYVEEVEGGLNRMMAVYSTDLPKAIGPIRSARISDLDLMAQYGKVAFAYSGAQTKLIPYLRRAPIYDIGADRIFTGYYRSSARRMPHNLYARPEQLLARAPKAATARDVGFRFGSAPAGGRPAASVTVGYPGSSVRFTWSASAKKWLISLDGRAASAAEGGRLSTPTVIIQYARVTDSGFGDKFGGRTPKTDSIGTGKALVLRDGKVYDVTWSRPSAGKGTTWTYQGEPMPLAAGQVWVVLQNKVRPATVS